MCVCMCRMACVYFSEVKKERKPTRRNGRGSLGRAAAAAAAPAAAAFGIRTADDHRRSSAAHSFYYFFSLEYQL